MRLRYFKPDTRIATRCESCGTQRLETLARLYSDARLLCAACGQEHTAERSGFRQSIEDTEAAVANLPRWAEKAASLLHRWYTDRPPTDAP